MLVVPVRRTRGILLRFVVSVVTISLYSGRVHCLGR